jgi:hypothetical protein
MLGARVLNRNDIFQLGLDILEGCWHTYNVTPVGVGPERTPNSIHHLMLSLEMEK